MTKWACSYTLLGKTMGPSLWAFTEDELYAKYGYLEDFRVEGRIIYEEDF